MVWAQNVFEQIIIFTKMKMGFGCWPQALFNDPDVLIIKS